MNIIKKETILLKNQLGLLKCNFCDYDENLKYSALIKGGKQLPENVCQFDDSTDDSARFLIITNCDYSPEEIDEYLKIKQAFDLHSIRKNLSFLKGVVLVSLICTAILTCISLFANFY